jgi:peptidoglycan hydrolase-like protein with peptidoglycan-binding domain
LGDKGGPTAASGEQSEEPLTSEEIEIIQERLQNLGYL